MIGKKRWTWGVWFFVLGAWRFSLGSIVFANDLSLILEKGWIVQDRNGDGIVDYVDCKIILPDNLSAELVQAASEIAFRLSFESEGITLPIVVQERELQGKLTVKNPIFLGDSIMHTKLLEKSGRKSSFPPNTASIEVIEINKDFEALSITGSDDRAILYAVRNFFSRYPYAWDVWGRKTGTTLEKVKDDVEKFFRDIGIAPQSITLKKVIFEDKEALKEKEPTGKELEYYEKDAGEVIALEVEVKVKDEELIKAAKALDELKDFQNRGEKTDILNYPSIASIEFAIASPEHKKQISIERIGFPERMLSRRLSPQLVRAKIKPKPKDITLSNLFTTKGLIKEEEKGVEKMDSMIVLTSSDYSSSIPEISFRLGLESTGITFPITIRDDDVKNFDDIFSIPILIGEKNRLTQHLIKTGKIKIPALKEGEGFLSIVPKAFDDLNAVIIAGDLQTASLHFSRNLPFIWRERKGGMELSKVEDEVKNFFKLRNLEGQASLARREIKEFLFRNPMKTIQSMNITLSLDGSKPGLAESFEDLFGGRVVGKEIKINCAPRRDEKKVFEIEKPIFYEVDEFWKIWKEKVSPQIKALSKINIDLRLSESPEIRNTIKEQIQSELRKKGVKREELSLRVLSAYKQGFSWIVDDIIPKLKGKEIQSFDIAFPVNQISPKPSKFSEEPTRWLSELYPVDEIIAKELGIPLSSIHFERINNSESPVYKVKVSGKQGILFEDSFSPFITTRPYLDKFPSWGDITIVEGGLKVEMNGKDILYARIKTDPEQFWDFYQKEILSKLYEHISKKTGGKPVVEKQPFFHTLKVEVWMSEPDYRLGIDEEMITSLESMHDEIYFDTLDFLEALLYKERLRLEEAELSKRFNAPGKIIPIIHPSRPGMAGTVMVSLSDYLSDKPKIQFKWKDIKGIERDEEKVLEPLSITSSKALSEIVDREKVKELGMVVQLTKDENAKAFDMIESLKEMREKGIFKDFLAARRLETISLNFQFESFQSTNSFPVFKQAAEIEAKEYKAPLIKFDHVTSPEEVIETSRILGNFPDIYAYMGGKSYEGRPIPVMEISLSSPSEIFSRNKKLLYKPTLLLTGRQHANEVSSTSYLLRLAELLATDNNYREFLKKVNVVIHPMENIDGAALAFELQKITPYFCLHAGRYSSLGADVGTQSGNPDTILTEALVRTFLNERWKPDIYLNLHGYPSHEWVQQFSGYNPYLFRQYWIPRGWYAFITHLEHPGYPFHDEAAQELLKYIDREINADPELSKINLNQYARYERWAERWQPHIHFIEMHKDTDLYYDRRSGRATKPSIRTDMTVVEATTEAMDETAQGRWLEGVSMQGLSFLRAHLKFLMDSEIIIHREEEENLGKVSITLSRIRPVRVQEKK